MKPLKFGCCDYAVFMTFIAYASGSVVMPVILPDIARSLDFPLEDGGMGVAGALHAIRSAAMVVTMLASGFAAAKFGVRRSLVFALLLMSFAIAGIMAAPGYAVLALLMLIAGLGEGNIEALATPAVERLHKDNEPGRYVNFSHAFWSVGVVLATVGTGMLLKSGTSWKYAVLLIAIMGILPVILLTVDSKQRHLLDVSEAEKGANGISDVFFRALEVLKNPVFWLFFGAIFFAGGGEWCLTFWLASYVRLSQGGSALAGGVVTALFACGMICGRMFSGMLVRQKYLSRLLICTGIAAALLGVVIPLQQDMRLLMVLTFALGIVIGPFWPSIQSVCVDKLKLDSVSIYILLSCAGIPGCGVFTWLQGVLADVKGIGLSGSFFLMPLSILLMIIFLSTAFLLCRRNAAKCC